MQQNCYFPAPRFLCRMLLAFALTVTCTPPTQAQRMYEWIGDVPKALKPEAPMPTEISEAMTKLEQEKRKKIVRPGATVPDTHRNIQRSYSQFIQPELNEFRIKVGNGEATVTPAPLYIANTSFTMEQTVRGKKPLKFDIKKDRLSYAIISEDEIHIINHANKWCSMSDFAFETNSQAIRLDGNKIELVASTLDIASGKYGITQKVICTHLPSKRKYTFEIGFNWPKVVQRQEEDAIYAFDILPSDSFPKLALMCNVKTKTLEVVQMPFIMIGDGKKGEDGKPGYNGANGINSSTYTDKDGKTHTVSGTCGTPGGNGGNGGRGGNGGTFLMCVSDTLLRQHGLQAISVTVEKGLGGKGGAAGQGGRHGTGSVCGYGRAANGRPGKNGADGKRGDFLFIVTNVNGFYQKVLKQ